MPSIFTRIINREIPASIVYEDDICIAILDINPIQKGHTLVIPKQELERMEMYNDEIIGHCFSVAKKIMIHQKAVLQLVTHVYLIVEGIQVPHRHIHLIPCYSDTPRVDWPQASYSDGEQDAYLHLLKVA